MVNLLPENYQFAFGSLITMLGIFGILSLLIHAPSGNQNQSLKKFQEDEYEANMTETKPIPKELIFNIDIVPLKLENTNYLKLETSVVEKIERFKTGILVMHNLEFVYPRPDVTNTELKLEFGPVTLQKFIQLEQNYNNYTQKLIDFATVLHENNMYDEAERVANELIKLKCTTSKPYIILMDIFIMRGERTKLLNLRNMVEEADFFATNEYSRKKILVKIHELL